MHAGPLEAAVRPLLEQQWRTVNSFRQALGQPPLPPPWETDEERAHRGHVAALKEVLADPAIAQALQAALPAPTTSPGEPSPPKPEKLTKEDAFFTDLIEREKRAFLDTYKNGDVERHLRDEIYSLSPREILEKIHTLSFYERELSAQYASFPSDLRPFRPGKGGSKILTNLKKEGLVPHKRRRKKGGGSGGAAGGSRPMVGPRNDRSREALYNAIADLSKQDQVLINERHLVKGRQISDAQLAKKAGVALEKLDSAIAAAYGRLKTAMHDLAVSGGDEIGLDFGE